MRYFCWVIFANLCQFWLIKFIGLIWNLNLSLNICLGFCTYLDIYIWAIFVFAWAYSAILLAEYGFMTHETRNFIEENETWKVLGKHWTCCKLVWVYVLFLTTIWCLFLLVSINICLYIFIECVQNWILNKPKILFK